MAVKGNRVFEQRMVSQNISYSITEELLSPKLNTYQHTEAVTTALVYF